NKRTALPIMSKCLPLSLFLFLALLTPVNANPDLADHYLARSGQYMGKTIKVGVAYVSAYTAGPSQKNYTWFNTFTATSTRIGGSITVRVNAKDAAAFAKKYGPSLQNANGSNAILTKPLSGIFSQTALKKCYIDCTDATVKNVKTVTK
ncbi:MAG: hypothetical protein ABIP97_08115, partial [Chthoniobacterales bacterium]